MNLRDTSSLNWLVTHELDRAAGRRHDAGWLAERLRDPSSAILLLWRDQPLFAPAAPETSQGARPLLLDPRAVILALGGEHEHDPDAALSAEATVFLGQAAGRAYFALEVPASDDVAARFAPWGEFRDLRPLLPLMGRWEAALAAYARAMLYWHRHHRFCCKCGSPTLSGQGGFLRRCTNADCGEEHFPRTDPAVIVRVTRDARILLGQQARWAPHMYSVIAGFVEPGESLETAVAREVLEETGIELAEVHYHSSQPWPFPASLMLGFTATAATDAIRLGDGELEDARWFTRAEIRDGLAEGKLRLPMPVAVSFRLIREWYDAANEGTLD
jgi:NAD+ diphosphatase